MITEVFTYEGFIKIQSYGEDDEALFLSGKDAPLAFELKWDISKGPVSVRYWITDKAISKAEADESFVKTLMGDLECEYESAYSEITGYLWTDEELNIGGHDLLAELESHKGKYLILEIEVHNA